jgi:RNA polymerase sigma-70 factor (ECF subfamily)
VTDWSQIVALYDALRQITPSPVVELNRAVAVAMRDGPMAGIELIEPLIVDGGLAEYHLAHAAKAELCRRAGQIDEARSSYVQALALVSQEPERRFLQSRLYRLQAK